VSFNKVKQNLLIIGGHNMGLEREVVIGLSRAISKYGDAMAASRSDTSVIMLVSFLDRQL